MIPVSNLLFTQYDTKKLHRYSTFNNIVYSLPLILITNCNTVPRIDVGIHLWIKLYISLFLIFSSKSHILVFEGMHLDSSLEIITPKHVQTSEKFVIFLILMRNCNSVPRIDVEAHLCVKLQISLFLILTSVLITCNVRNCLKYIY